MMVSPSPSVSPSPCPCEIESVLADKSVVCLGTMVNFSALVDNSCDEEEKWSAPGGTPSTGSGTSFATAWSSSGPKTVTFDCGEQNASVGVVVVAIDRVILQGSSPQDQGPIRTCVGSGRTLLAIPTPLSPGFPAGSPAWQAQSKPTGSAVSAPPNGSVTASITPDLPGAYVVRASCGGSSKTFTLHAVKVVVALYQTSSL